MNNSPQNTEVAGQQHRAGVENSDEEEWSGVVECVMLLHRLVYRKNDFYLLKQPSSSSFLLPISSCFSWSRKFCGLHNVCWILLSDSYFFCYCYCCCYCYRLLYQFLRFMLVDVSVDFIYLINPDYRASISKNASYVLGYVNFVATLYLGCR